MSVISKLGTMLEHCPRRADRIILELKERRQIRPQIEIEGSSVRLVNMASRHALEKEVISFSTVEKWITNLPGMQFELHNRRRATEPVSLQCFGIRGAGPGD